MAPSGALIYALQGIGNQAAVILLALVHSLTPPRLFARALRPDHINLESLGNVVPHLHFHVVPRFLGDARWGAPIWLTAVADMLETRLEPGERAALIESLRKALSG